ncbi:MAG: alpha/beta hydrolase [Betaproteobacteria bacterium]|nr:alpha/beta hydrolase [Betaproteobacteria bacterium]
MSFQTVRVGDIDIRYELADYTLPWRRDPPETVLLHHGYARNMLFWQPLVPLLAGSRRVLRFDARGCGETTQSPPGRVYSFEQFVNDATGLMDALGIESVHWVGESSGGIVGLCAALTRAARLQTLTLCDTPFKRSSDIATTYAVGESDRAAAFEKYGVGGWCRKTLSYRLDTTKATPELCEWYIAQMDRIPKPIAVALERMIGQGDLWPRLPEITTPTLILAGEKSPIATESLMQSMRERMPAAKSVTLRGYGHGVNLLAPEECAREIKAFIESQRKRVAA